MSTTVFIGGGRITGALVAGLCRAGHQGTIVIHDRNPEKLRALERDFAVAVEPDLQSAVAESDMLILAVRPPAVADAVDHLARRASHSGLLAVCLAAGIPLKKLRRSGSEVRWARALPSPICRIGRGLTAVSFARNWSLPDRNQVRGFFEQVGPVLEMAESRMDAFNAAYSPALGYHALDILAKTAQAAGLDARMARTAGAHALADAILYWRESGHNLSDLLQEAATPGGTSAATLAAMDTAGYKKSIERGIAAGIRQARANARR